MDDNRPCPYCGHLMARGRLSITRFSTLRIFWVPEEAEDPLTIFGRPTEGRRLTDRHGKVSAFRCAACGKIILDCPLEMEGD